MKDFISDVIPRKDRTSCTHSERSRLDLLMPRVGIVFYLERKFNWVSIGKILYLEIW